MFKTNQKGRWLRSYREPAVEPHFDEDLRPSLRYSVDCHDLYQRPISYESQNPGSKLEKDVSKPACNYDLQYLPSAELRRLRDYGIGGPQYHW